MIINSFLLIVLKILKDRGWSLLNLVKKDIKVAKYAGFCYGVKRAVDLSVKVKEDNPHTPVYIYGQLIHNNQVIEYLNSIGICTIEEIPDELNGICIIRTHGVTPQTIKELETKNCQIIDATCPDVKHVQDKVIELSKEGYRVVIIGKANHPEVVGIKAHADLYSDKAAIVISPEEEVDKHLIEIEKSKKIGIVIQTTQLIENLKNILPTIMEHSKELKIYKICIF